MAAERPARRTSRKHSSGRGTAATLHPSEKEPLLPERRFVDIDPWAVLLEQLMEAPEEEPVERNLSRGGRTEGANSAEPSLVVHAACPHPREPHLADLDRQVLARPLTRGRIAL